ncbi:MAG: hypothetical protein D6820_11800 [Lentisphaerae bacterium]|nr:MAG: hypothetical protein D6820_11800 [Lentisphaerota bacterium]
MALSVQNVSFDCEVETVSCSLTGGPPYPIHVYAQVYDSIQNPVPDIPPQDCMCTYINGTGGNILISSEGCGSPARPPGEGPYHAIVWAPSETGYVRGDATGECEGGGECP